MVQVLEKLPDIRINYSRKSWDTPKKKKFKNALLKKNTIYETARIRDILFDKTLFDAFRERYVRAHV